MDAAPLHFHKNGRLAIRSKPDQIKMIVACADPADKRHRHKMKKEKLFAFAKSFMDPCAGFDTIPLKEIINILP